MQPPPSHARVVQAAVLVCAACVGCGPDLQQQIEALATPTRALESGHAELVKQIKAVERARGLPSQLDKADSLGESNAATALDNAYSEALHLRLMPVVEELLEPEAEAAKRAAFVSTNKLLIDKTAAAIDLPRCQFSVGHRYGFFARMKYLDDATLASRLLRLRATHAGAEKDRETALADLLRSLRVANRLSQVRRGEARILAATLRADALELARSLLDAGLFRRFECERLYAALRDKLVEWPSESGMLVGDRATVIHSYEAIRAGMLGKLITLDERQRLRNNSRLQRMEAATPGAINDDQAAYLAAMSGLMAAADRPHATRLEAIAAALEELRAAPALFARSLFIEDLPEAFRLTAADRARAEAWTIALAASAQLKTPPFRDSPLNGRPYQVERDAARVTVTYGDDTGEAVDLPVVLSL